MQCSSCGTILSPGVSVCPKCGSRTSSNNYVYEDAIPYDVVSYDAVPYMESRPTIAIEPKTTPAPVSPFLTPITPQPPVTPAPAPAPMQKTLSPFAPQRPQQPRRPLRWEPVLLVILLLILIGGSAAAIGYATITRPADLRTRATATAHNFLNAQTQHAAQAALQATATADALSPDQIYQQATSGTPVIDDPLQDDSSNIWFHYGQKPNQCIFQAGAYHLQAASGGTNYCIGLGTFFSNLAFQTQITIIKGDAAGVMFRFNGTPTTLSAYAFIFSTSGNYAFATTTQQQGNNIKTGASPTIVTGLKRSNQLTVIARGSHIYIYINGKFVDSIVDTKYTSGQIAFIGSSPVSASDVAFSNVKVWGL